MQSHKIELRNKDFFIRGYNISETAGNSYDMRFTGINMNKYQCTGMVWNLRGSLFASCTWRCSDGQAHAGARIAADDAETLTAWHSRVRSTLQSGN